MLYSLKNISKYFLALFAILLLNCSAMNVQMMDDVPEYLPSQKVKIISQVPDVPYQIIAKIELKGRADATVFELVEEIKEKAKELGADAIIPILEEHEQKEFEQVYDPWVGVYFGGRDLSNVVAKAYAIKFVDEEK